MEGLLSTGPTPSSLPCDTSKLIIHIMHYTALTKVKIGKANFEMLFYCLFMYRFRTKIEEEKKFSMP